MPYDGGYAAVFAFNANGDILRKENLPWGGGNTNYIYDSEGRLTETVNRGDEDEPEICKYSYDEKGNLIRLDVYEGDELYEYYTYEYDENGNKISETLKAGGNGKIKHETAYEYDADGNLIEPESDSDCVYEYDADGNIIKETYDGITTEHIYENGLLVKSVRNGEIICEYTYFDNNNIVRRYWYESEGTIGEININLYSELF